MTVDDTRTGTEAALGFEQTVPRRFVHRAAVSEVFVTDAARLGEWAVCVAAQLPPSHAYFGDHDGTTSVDPMVLLEVFRQAAIYGGHLIGIPLTTTMLINASTLRIAAGALPAVHGPVGVVVDSTFEARRVRRNRPQAGVIVQRLTRDGTEIATNEFEAVVLTREHHDAVRRTVRDGPIPTTGDLTDTAHPDAVEPRLVGRAQAANVVLAAARAENGTRTALVAPRLSNRALFDHTYDHLPGAVLTEAARQLAVLATGSPATPVLGVAARFPRFAELDAPVTASTPAPAPGATTVPVVLEQDGETVASVTVTLAPTPRGGHP